MKKLGNESALTLIELLVVVAVIAILAVMLLPALANRGRPKGLYCLVQIRQIQIAFIEFEEDNHGEFPFQISATNGGTLELVHGGQVAPHFQKLSAYLKTPSIFYCPLDTSRTATTNYAVLTDQTISYFLNVDASVTTNKPAQLIMTGDRVLMANGQPVKTGLFAVTTNMHMTWTPDAHKGRGNLGFLDGHAEVVKSDNLNSYFQGQPLAANRILVP